MISELLREELKKKGILLTASQAEAFLAYDKILREWNEKMSLTSISSEEETVQKHYLDSLAPLWLNLIPEKGIIADIGAGAGFPSIPLCIMCPWLQGVLIESIRKKCLFLQAVVETLGLNARVLNGRVEEQGKKELFHQCDIVVARAVAPLPKLISYAAPLLNSTGRALFYKGPSVAEEMQEARRIAKTERLMIKQHDCGISGMEHLMIEVSRA